MHKARLDESLQVGSGDTTIDIGKIVVNTNGQLGQFTSAMPYVAKELTRGVIYYNTGNKCLVRLLVSLYSLRNHYNGPVTILSEGEESYEYCGPIAKQFGAQLVPVQLVVPEGAQTTFMKKTQLHTVTPYDISVFMDSDTLVRGNIDKLFTWAEEHEFVATGFCNWATNGKIMSGRINAWKKHYPELIERAIAFGPALNAGCYAFNRDATFLKVWYKMTLPGRDIHLPEETSMQVILPGYPHYIAPQEYNCSCKFSDPYHPDVRIIHYHRNKHCRAGLPFAADLWVRHYNVALSRNYANLRDWHLKFDRTLAHYVRGTKVEKRKPKEEPMAEPDQTSVIDVIQIPTTKHRVEDMTIVSAVSPNCLYSFKANFPSWQAKPQLSGLPMLIFHNGFDDPERELDFVTRVEGAQLIHWTMPESANTRELMISSFVLGAVRHVKTTYYLKLDADCYFAGREDVFDPSHFEYDLCGHRWGVSRGEMLLALDAWAESIDLPGNPFLDSPEKIQQAKTNVKFQHGRIISWICLHKTKFVQDCVEYTGGLRLPVPSHDTFLWYMANRLGRRWQGTRLNKGTGHGKRMAQYLEARKLLAKQGFVIKE